MLSYLLVIILFVVPSIIISWKLVAKAGQPGWSQLIPAWNWYIVGRVAKKPTLGIVIAILAVLDYLLRVFGATFLPLSIAFLVIGLIVLNFYIKQFNAGVGKWALWIFLPFIGVFFVDKTAYIGGVTPAAPAAPSAPVAPAAPIAPAAPVAPVTFVAPTVSTEPAFQPQVAAPVAYPAAPVELTPPTPPTQPLV